MDKNSTKKQKHGFIYENSIIKKYNLNKCDIYNDKFDCYYNNTPVQIKYTKNKGEICLADYKRNKELDNDFILHIGIYENENNIKTTIQEYTLYIDFNVYIKLFNFDINNIIEEFKIISNDKLDDGKYKLFKKKYKNNNDDIVHIRFKRDHKKQKRIQASIPYRHIRAFIQLFKPYTFQNEIKKELNRRDLEKFYTKEEVVKICMKNIEIELEKSNIEKPIHILEPSAGNGVFLNEFKDYTYDAYDIYPENDKIIKADFLLLKINDIITNKGYKSLIIIGNPPYKLSIKFINKCAELNPYLICFILPNVFKKPTIINKINRNYHILNTFSLPKKSFKLSEDDYDVPSSLFIFIRKQELRSIINTDIVCENYEYVRFKDLKIDDNIITNADIAIIRVGGRAGTAFLTTDISDNALVSKQKYNYFIKLHNKENIDEIIKNINTHIWDKNNTTGARSIGKYELNPVLNKIINKKNELKIVIV